MTTSSKFLVHTIILLSSSLGFGQSKICDQLKNEKIPQVAPSNNSKSDCLLILGRKGYADYGKCILSAPEASSVERAEVYIRGWGVPSQVKVAQKMICDSDLRETLIAQIVEAMTAKDPLRENNPSSFEICSFIVNEHPECLSSMNRKSYAEWLAMKEDLKSQADGRLLKAQGDLEKSIEGFAEKEAAFATVGCISCPSEAMGAENSIRRRYLWDAMKALAKGPCKDPGEKELADLDHELNRLYQKKLKDWETEKKSQSSVQGSDSYFKELAIAYRDAERSWVKAKELWENYYEIRFAKLDTQKNLRRCASLAQTKIRLQDIGNDYRH